MRVVIIGLLLLGACKKGGTQAVSSDLPGQGTPAPPEESPPDPAPVPKPTKQSLYAECQDRVESPQAEGECKTDADCTKAGCASEVCTTTAAAKELMTTCDMRYCYQVLDTCGCHDGQCTWTLKDPGPAPPPNRLPPM